MVGEDPGLTEEDVRACILLVALPGKRYEELTTALFLDQASTQPSTERPTDGAISPLFCLEIGTSDVSAANERPNWRVVVSGEAVEAANGNRRCKGRVCTRATWDHYRMFHQTAVSRRQYHRSCRNAGGTARPSEHTRPRGRRRFSRTFQLISRTIAPNLCGDFV